MKDELNSIELIPETIESMVYIIRGQKVMLDYDLAKIYGYETKTFNQQVKNNSDKFPDVFMFKLSRYEYHQTLLSKILTSDLLSSQTIKVKTVSQKKLLMILSMVQG